jgi:hypothetical protein
MNFKNALSKKPVRNGIPLWSDICPAIPKDVPVRKPTSESIISAFALNCGALWGDIVTPIDLTEQFFLESAQKKKTMQQRAHDEALQEAPKLKAKEDERIKEAVARREKLLAQAQQVRLPCRCCKKLLVHTAPPRPDVGGLCCGYCEKTGGKGHGESCQHHSA